MQRRNKRSSCLPYLFLIGLSLLACLVVLVLVGGLFEMTRRTTELFGPPAPGTGFVQRLRLSAQLLMQTDDLTVPSNPFGAEQPFEIALGETPPAIAARLHSNGLIPNARAFTTYLQYAGLDITLQSGKYSLSPGLTPLEIAGALQDATPKEVTLAILEGWRLEEIAGTLPTSGLEISSQEFMAASRSRPQGYAFLDELPEGNSLEGFLFPGSYEVPRETNAAQLITILLDSFIAQLTPELTAGFEAQGLTVNEAVNLAAIVERESVVAGEMPLIASVLLNRLAIGMPLEADSTAQYALGYNPAQKTWWTNPLSLSDLEVDSPYNTYRHPGLPPGPIANPGISALRAVAFPAQTPYYYFRATCDGSGKHTFAETFEQHVGNECP